MSAMTLHQHRVRTRRRRTLLAGTVEVPVDKVLLGGQGRLSARDYAAATDDPLWASRQVAEGPHVRLLRAHAVRELDDRDILTSDYGRFARRSLALSGRFHDATDDVGVLRVARDFLLRSSPDAGPVFPRPGQTTERTPIRVAPIRDSDCFQLVDGYHRVAAYVVSGAETVPVRVNRLAVTTPLQDMLHRMAADGRSRELLQPVTLPEVATWPTVRRCSDRLAMMDRLLGSLELSAGRASYLDVGSCYGWFVAGMSRFGYRSEGVDPDPLARTIGEQVRGLDRSQVHTAGIVPFLRDASAEGVASVRGATPQRWDIVSSFSLLHHFVLGRGDVSPQRFVELLDAVTGSVLFLDTGQAHEKWFRHSLAGWDAAHVRGFLEQHTTFDEVIDLGPDHDDQPPYSGNHGRHLFACVRHSR